MPPEREDATPSRSVTRRPWKKQTASSPPQRGALSGDVYSTACYTHDQCSCSLNKCASQGGAPPW